ncbi:MAG: hypothetical protein H0V82_13305 [Candidatus Protochlamydia sp.]|nr:hypothetical protein [Candidatus Protochlamydia sp.]
MKESFEHVALTLKGGKPLVYTALSKTFFYFRMHISRYVLEQGCVPLNPFMLFEYFLLDAVERDVIRDANNSVVLRSDQLWVFGPISNGVLAEVLIARKNKLPILYFKIDNKSIIPISQNEVELEEEIKQHKGLFFC